MSLGYLVKVASHRGYLRQVTRQSRPMSKKSRATIATAMLAVAGTLLALAPTLEAPLARASQGELFPDTDGDFLPDSLEYGTYSNPIVADSDGDGVGDFLATVRHLRSDPRAAARPEDHEMRVLLSSETRGDGSRALWMHLLFRFVGDSIPPIEQLDPYIYWRTWRLPLSQLVGYGQAEIKLRQSPEHGLFALVSLELGDEEDIRFIRPYSYTIGVDASLDGRQTSSGIFIQAIDDPSTGGDVFASLVPMNSGQVSYQFLNQHDSENPFWSTDRICLMTLELFSRGTEGHICEIIGANCEPLEGDFRCPPTCPDSVGSLMFFPNGMTTIFGGG